MMKKVLLLSTLVILIPFLGETKNLYVNNSGSPPCSDETTYANNSASNPWCTIGRAAWGSINRSAPNSAEAAKAGDTVYITAGIYTTTGTNSGWGVAYNPVNSGSPGNRITFEAVGTVVLRYSSGAGPMIGAVCYDNPGGSHARSYITWRGFTISEQTAPTLTDKGMVTFACGSNNTVENCILDGNDNGAKGNNHSGIWLQSTDYPIVRNNLIYNVLNFGSFHHNAGGIMSYYVNDATIENNEIYNCGSGMTLKGGNNERWTIRNNYLRNNGTGVAIVGNWDYSTGYGRIYQNIIENNLTGVGFGGSIDPYRRFIIANNTLYNNSNGGVSCGWTAQSLTNVFVQNNIIVGSYEQINMGDCPSNYCSTIQFDRNNYHNGNRFSNNGVAYTSLSAWQTHLGGCPNTGNECSSIVENPLFVGGSGVEAYKLQSGSPAKTLGRTITEIHGNSEQTIPAGAYITGNEVIGRNVSMPNPPPAPPTGFGIR